MNKILSSPIKINIIILMMFLTIALPLSGKAQNNAIPQPQNPHLKEWSFSLGFGIQQPDLSALHNNLFKVPVTGLNEVTVNQESGGGELQPYEFNKPLTASHSGAKAAIELQWHPNRKHSLTMGMASWEKTASVLQPGILYVQGVSNDVNVERRASLSYTEYNLGWRYNFYSRSKFSFYSQTAIHEIFDINYREDHVFSFVGDSELAGFKRIVIYRAQTTALLLINLSVGGEWFFQPWFSLGAEAGYLLGTRNAELSRGLTNSDFIQNADNVFPTSPFVALSDGKIGYLTPESTPNQPEYKKIPLDFSGWQVLVRMNFYY